MALDQERIQEPARKLRKLLKKMPTSPAPKDIHSFRTNSRRLETVLETFPLDDTKTGRKLFKQVSKLRKRAGKVRDFDVLTDFVSGVPHDPSERECSVRLLEYLGTQREKQARKFHKLQKQYFSALRRNLKRASKKIEGIFPPKGDGRLNAKPVTATVSAAALAHLSDLTEPPQLRKSNLHEYRLKVKALRNLLQMAENPDKQPFVDRLGQVKDAIGEWHDWEVLVAITKDALDHGNHCRLVEHLRNTAATKFGTALRLAEAMRRKDLRMTTARAKNSSKIRPRKPAEHVWSATASLAA
ncbi:MAG TPA: CHAD domain-containing protein [Candidatus Sulfotelmatobacter sp.]|nr:CHAD domain-containing protein [Candidatus Sulfotelmatobacter sp.]